MDENKKPQLVMFREDLDDLALLNLPVDYKLRSFQPGDEEYWEGIIDKSFNKKLDFKEEHSTGDTFFLSREGDVSSGCCG